ncbi:MAG: metalloregulator ArsR/SmtB family transcription factor [Chloroflexota bacterium]|nr:metalloregulator ArsR/SmtB family transcription factor [Chloroflexota bacterium]
MTANTQAVSWTEDVSRFFRLLSDDTRRTIIRLLAFSDMRVGELTERLRVPQNAVSYHLRQLRDLGLLRDRRGGYDARDVYYSVDLDRLRTLYLAAGNSLHAGLAPTGEEHVQRESSGDHVAQPLRILFLCTHNSARSQMAEAIARKLGGDSVEVYSAGSEVSELHPITVRMLEEWDIDTRGYYSKTLDQFLGQEFDYIITTCDRANESCPVFPGDPKRIHWSFPDPKQIEDPEQQLRAFQTTRSELCTRIRYLLNLRHPRTGERIRVGAGDIPAERA